MKDTTVARYSVSQLKARNGFDVPPEFASPASGGAES